MKQRSAIIIGGGVTGLTLGWAMQRAGWRFRVLEKATQAGGAIQTIREAGYLAEAGPNSLLVNSRALDSLIRGMGLTKQMQHPNPEAKKRYILRGGEFRPAPMSPGELISSDLLTGKGKLRVLVDLFSRAPANLAEESLARFVERHFGQEILDYAVNPFVGGIYAGDPRKLSAQHAFPMLAEAEQTAGSVIRGMIARKKAQKRAGEHFKSYCLSFANGMQALPEALASKLGQDLTLGAEVTEIERTPAGWRAVWQTADGSDSVEAEELYLTIPTHGLEQLMLPSEVARVLAPLGEIEHPPVASVALGYPRENVAHALDGFGGLIPEVEHRKALGVLFSSSLFPGRAPKGKALLTVFIGGSRQPELARKSTAEIQAIAEREVNQLLGVSGAPEFARVTIWSRAIPQYNVGYGEFLAAIESAEHQFPGLNLMGNFRGGISIGNCLMNAANAVEPVG